MLVATAMVLLMTPLAYAPVCHWVWGSVWLDEMDALDLPAEPSIT